MFPANHVLHHREENTDDQNRLCCRTQHGVPGGVELGIIPIPSFPSPRPPPSPSALDCYGSRGYDRAVARARYLLGILELWISQPIAWMQQGLEDGVEMCRALDWEEPYLPRTEIGRVGFKTWCTDKCLNAHCLDRWGLFHRHPGGEPHLHCVYILWLVEGKDIPNERLPVGHPRPCMEHSRRPVPQDMAVDRWPGNSFLALVVYLNFSYYKYLRWLYFILII